MLEMGVSPNVYLFNENTVETDFLSSEKLVCLGWKGPPPNAPEVCDGVYIDDTLTLLLHPAHNFQTVGRRYYRTNLKDNYVWALGVYGILLACGIWTTIDFTDSKLEKSSLKVHLPYFAAPDSY
jgi:hypothetical protein